MAPVSAQIACAGHYGGGTNGGAEGWVPPPGFSVRFDVTSIRSDELYDADENQVPVDFDLDVLATVPSFTYTTAEPLILGARYGARLVTPFVNKHQQVTAGGVATYSDSDTYALGDIDIQPIMLGWGGHDTQYDSMIGLGFVLPTGSYQNNTKVHTGEGYYTAYLMGGMNYYFDKARTFYVSGLFHLLYNGEQDDTDIDIGEELVFEYGIGKTFMVKKYALRVGLAGYAQWKEADDDPADPDTDASAIYGIGPEIELASPAAGWSLESRYYIEFGAKNNPESKQFVLCWVKGF